MTEGQSKTRTGVDLAGVPAEIRRLFPTALGAYLFGSGASDQLRETSDIDLAILSVEPIAAELAFSLKAFISRELRRDSDIVDLARADSVTAAQVVVFGIPVFVTDATAMGHFETMVMSRYALLNEERAEILADIVRRGAVYGR